MNSKKYLLKIPPLPNGEIILSKALDVGMTNMHSWVSGQADPLLLMSWEALADRNSPSRANVSCFYDACSKALLVKLPIFSTNVNISWLFALPVSFLETLWGREDPAPTLDALDTEVSIFHRLISLHHTAQHMLSSRNTQENSNIKFIAFLVAKKNTFLPNTTSDKLFSATIAPAQTQGSCPVGGLRKSAAGKGSCKPCPWLGVRSQQPQPGLDLESDPCSLYITACTFLKGVSPASFCLGTLW